MIGYDHCPVTLPALPQPVLRLLPDVPRQVPRVDELIDQLVGLAAKGEIVALLVAFERRKGGTDSTIAGEDWHPHRLLGELAVAQQYLVDCIREDLGQ